MARRPPCRLLTGHFDLCDVSYRTEHRPPSRLPAPAVETMPFPIIGSPERKALLASGRLWKVKDKYAVLRPDAQQVLGHYIILECLGKKRWKWAIRSIMRVGTSSGLDRAKRAALEELLRWIGPPASYTALRRLGRLAGYEFT